MKVTCETKEETFKPVTISITCESKEELFALWHRFNINSGHVWKQSNQETTGVPNGEPIVNVWVWSVINEEVQKIAR